MDLAMALAERIDADLVVANDPDADRCAAAVPGPHGWRMLRGDEVGALLAHYLLSSGQAGHLRGVDRVVVPARQAGRRPRPAVRRDPDRLQVDQPRRGPGVRLRGGARLLRRPRAREGQGRRLGAADAVRARRRRQGGGPDPRRPARRHRPHARAARDRPALRPGHRPVRDRPRRWTRCDVRLRRRLGGLAVEQVDDLALGSADLPPTDGLRYRLADGARVIVRPSGTEPKLKAYLEVVVPVEAGPTVATSTPPGSPPRAGSMRSARDIKAAAGI